MANDHVDFYNDLQKLRQNRLDGIRQEIREWSHKPIDFSFNPVGTPLYSIEETKRAYCRRFAEFADSSNELLRLNRVVPAAIVARAQIETVAMATFFLHEVTRLIEVGNLEKFESRVHRFIVGNKAEGSKTNAVHVMDALRHLHDLDEAYMTYLWGKYPPLRSVYKALLTAGGEELQAQHMVAMISVTKNYDLLSEFAHPNGLGTFFIYGLPENAGEDEAAVLSHLAYLTGAATWQGHHLTKALADTERLAESYREKFLK